MRAKAISQADAKESRYLSAAARGAQDSYIHEHEKEIQEIKEKWLYAPAYRHTPAEVGGIKNG